MQTHAPYTLLENMGLALAMAYFSRGLKLFTQFASFSLAYY